MNAWSQDALFADARPPYHVQSMAERGSIPRNGLVAASTFSGCGGSSLGLKTAGFTIPYAVEFTDQGAATYRANFPDTFVDQRDVRTITPEEVLAKLGLEPGELDLFEGSPPCSSFSGAGTAKSGQFGDTRGKVKNYSGGIKQTTDDLFLEWVRLIEGIRPKAVLAENVPDMLKAGDARRFAFEVQRLLDTHGEKALDLIDGMWAVAWFDKRDGMVRLARDRWGKVPLYVTTDGATVYWASEYKAIPAGLQAEAIPPGGCIVVDPDGDSYGHQWTIDVPFATSAPEPDEVLHLLRQGVRERLVGDRAIAFLLSGGLDSSLVLALAAEQGYAPLVAYTAVLDPASHDLVAARYVAEEYGAELIEVRVPYPNELVIREAVRTIEIPMKAQVEIAMAHMPVMHEVAKDGFAVCLSGEAADELFGGYGGMCIKASKSTDDEYRQIKLDAVEKMARGNFSRVNKVGMRYGVEIRLPFMQAELVELALQASKAESPPAKKLLKQAATGVLPNWIIKRPKQTFQGGTGINGAAAAFTDGPSRYYNQVARELFGYIPRS